MRWREVREAFVDEKVGQRRGVDERTVELFGFASRKQIGGVVSVWELGDGRVEPVGCEEPVVAFGGDPAGEIGIGGDDGLLLEAAELSGLARGEACPECSDTEMCAAGGDADGNRVKGTLRQDGIAL